MVVTILYRLAGEPAASGSTFTDVSSGSYYEKAVAWANANGIVTGYSSDRFGPNDPVTREQFAAMLHRYAKHTGMDVSVSEETNILSYSDALSIHDYAMDAMQWACGAGLIQGSDRQELMPLSSTTRAQLAAILDRFTK